MRFALAGGQSPETLKNAAKRIGSPPDKKHQNRDQPDHDDEAVGEIGLNEVIESI